MELMMVHKKMSLVEDALIGKTMGWGRAERMLMAEVEWKESRERWAQTMLMIILVQRRSTC
jgi:hypothetical protein